MKGIFSMLHLNSKYIQSNAKAGQCGASLILVMIILTIVSMIGIAGIQISTMSERSARNDRDYQIAWQSAEAGLVDATLELYGSGTSLRRNVFEASNVLAYFVDGCGTTGDSRGLCTLAQTGRPTWVDVNFETTGSAAPTTEYGQFTNRTFTAGGAGVQPARRPRYVMEPIRDDAGPGSQCRNLALADCPPVFRITAMGFGPRVDIQAVLQIIYRK